MLVSGLCVPLEYMLAGLDEHNLFYEYALLVRNIALRSMFMDRTSICSVLIAGMSLY